MKEIEVKILDIDVNATIRKLTTLGARHLFHGEIITVYCDTKDKAYSKLDQTIRARLLKDTEDRVLICHKGPNQSKEFKSRLENELEIHGTLEDALAFLSCLGLVEYDRQSKLRQSYQLGTARIEIDKRLDIDIPAWLEIEAPTETEVVDAVTRLGYTMKQTVTYSQRQLEKHYGIKKN